MATESKVISIRASDEIRERFQAFLDAEGVKAGEMLEKLIDSYEQESSMPRHKAEFDDFNAHLDALKIKFLNAYNTLANTEERISVQYTDKIKLLEEQNAKLEEREEQSQETINRLAELEQTNADLREQIKLLKDKQDFDNSLLEKVKESIENAEKATELQHKLDLQAMELKTANEKIKELQEQLKSETKRAEELQKTLITKFKDR